MCVWLKVKYVGDEKGKGKGKGLENGLSSIDKTLFVEGARISYTIWEVGGNVFFLKFFLFFIYFF